MLTTLSDHRSVYRLATPANPVDRASLLDRQADAELQVGRVMQAERLSWRAAEMRGTA